jgi:organic hydroperoxide reductase OsmC/OhrA
MVDYPISFNSVSEATNEENEWSLETGEGLHTEMSVPKEFGGGEEKPSPEDLFAASIQSCLLATFKTIAERKALDYEKIESRAEINLDRGEDSRPIMKNGKIELDIKGVEDKYKALEVAESAEKNCFIHNSVKTDIETEINFS